MHNDEHTFLLWWQRRQRPLPVIDVDGGVRASRLPRRRREMAKYLVQYRTCWLLCNWIITDAVPPGSAFYISEERHAEVLEASWGSRTAVVAVVRKSWTRHASRGCVVRRSCSGPFNQSWRSHAEVVPCDRYTKYYKSHGAVCLFQSRRRHRVHGAPCDWGIIRCNFLLRNIVGETCQIGVKWLDSTKHVFSGSVQWV